MYKIFRTSRSISNLVIASSMSLAIVATEVDTNVFAEELSGDKNDYQQEIRFPTIDYKNGMGHPYTVSPVRKGSIATKALSAQGNRSLGTSGAGTGRDGNRR